jgi:cellulose biosynthesis protein BcsQ
MLTINALTAARELLIPMSMEYLALRGLDIPA